MSCLRIGRKRIAAQVMVRQHAMADRAAIVAVEPAAEIVAAAHETGLPRERLDQPQIGLKAEIAAMGGGGLARLRADLAVLRAAAGIDPAVEPVIEAVEAVLGVAALEAV